MSPRKQLVIFFSFVIGCVLLLYLIFGTGGGRSGSNSSRSKKKSEDKSIVLTDYIDKDSQVFVTTEGSVNGEDVHRSIRISVSSSYRQIDIVEGYQNKVIKTKTYSNNQDAYHEFMYALSKTGYGKTRKTDIPSEDGVCATGERYIFEVLDNGDSASRTWTADCMKGSSPASPDKVTHLFEEQITDYDDITKDVKL